MLFPLARLAKLGWKTVLVSTVAYLAGGAFSAWSWQPEPAKGPKGESPPAGTPTERRGLGTDNPQSECNDPPCFDPGGMPSAEDLPVVLPMLGYVVATLFGVPALLKWFWSVSRGEAAEGQRGWLMFFGPLLVFVGVEVLPHVVSPCALAYLTDRSSLPAICTLSQHGVDIGDQWHALSHGAAGALPMTALLRLALKRWKPEVLGGARR